MIKSMTGFGSASGVSKKLQIHITIRAVNGRFLEIRPHMPRLYQALETELKKTVGQNLSRGTVDLYITRRATDDETSQISINKAMAKKWKDSYFQLARDLKLGTPSLSVETLASLPDVVMVEEVSTLSADEKKRLFQVVGAALKKVEQEREREGQALAKELKRLLDQLKSHAVQIRGWLPQIHHDLEGRFAERAKKWQGEVDPQRLAQEVAFYIDKSDVSEELQRLEEHLDLFLKMTQTKQKEPQGKKLDFYCQELLREINTIGSKSSQVKLTQIVVNAKSVIEKLREQVQNIE
jgi:uncharacterized protein (TIGR00255 family)